MDLRGGNREIGEQGFTLLELLISIFLILLVTLITTGAMRLGYRSVESGDKRIDAQERFRTSLHVIESQIQSAIPIGSEEEGIEKVYFKGERDTMQFSSNYSIWDGRRGYLIAAYSVEQGADGKKRLSASENTIGMSAKRQTPLMNAMDDIYFEYMSAALTEDGSWVSEWSDPGSVPEKVRIRMAYQGREFSMVIPMRVKRLVAQTGSIPGNLLPGAGGSNAK